MVFAILCGACHRDTVLDLVCFSNLMVTVHSQQLNVEEQVNWQTFWHFCVYLVRFINATAAAVTAVLIIIVYADHIIAPLPRRPVNPSICFVNGVLKYFLT